MKEPGRTVRQALFGAGATASFVTLLPLRGVEFSILSVLVLVTALVVTARKMAEPVACEVPVEGSKGDPAQDEGSRER